MFDSSTRIRSPILNAMNNILLILNSLHSTKIDDHPKLLIIFNDLSKNEDFKAKEKIESYKRQLKDFLKAFYLSNKVSDLTRFGKESWKQLKVMACKDENYV